MSSFNRHAKADAIKWVVCFTLIAMLIVAMIFAFVRIDKNEDTKTLGTGVFTYSVGAITDEGKLNEDTDVSIVTADYYTVDGLNCDLQDKADVTYKLFFYDAEKNFISATDALDEDFDGTSVPENAEYFRVQITPVEDSEVSFFEIGTYGKQLSVVISK